MNQVISIRPGENFKVFIEFSDGFSGELNVYPFIKGGISGKLKDPDFFRNVRVDEFGGISWENGFDFCPNFLYDYLQSCLKAT
jgi:hypothetical protein